MPEKGCFAHNPEHLSEQGGKEFVKTVKKSKFKDVKNLT